MTPAPRFASLSRPPSDLRLPPAVLVAVTALAALELLRALGPLLSAVAARDGGPWATVVTVACLAAPGLAGPLVWWVGLRRAVTCAVGGLAAVLLVAQVPAARSPLVLGAAAALSLAALVPAVRRSVAFTEDGPARTARAVTLAVAVDLAMRLVLDLWDPLWRGGFLGWAWAVVLVAALAVPAYAQHQDRAAVPPRSRLRPGQLALLGPALALYGVVIVSPGYLSAQSGMSQTAAGLWLGAGLVLGLAVLAQPGPPGGPRGTPAVLVAGVTLLLLTTGVLAAVAATAAAAALPAVLARALTPARGAPSGGGHQPLTELGLAGLGCGLGYLLVALPYELGLWLLPVAAAVLLGWASLRVRHPARPTTGALLPVALATVALAVPPLADAARGGPEPLPTATGPDSFRLLSWNVRLAADEDGEPVPDRVLEVIRDSGAHVVVLQEVPRGLPGHGGLDLRAWLERRLDVRTVWAPADGRHSGNLILTGLPVGGSEAVRLPRAGGSEGRSWAAATVRLESGLTSRVVTTHLQHGDGARDTRLRQLEALLHGDVDPSTVLAGDFNAAPGSAEVDTVLDAGFRSAQEEAGDPQEPTRPGQDPPDRVDWIFGARDVAFTGFELLGPAGSDHRPLLVTVHLP
ncbi:hypothetical protein GCM10009716_22600 [Streptomyces sodiiphilus]|uniref:Endonuclease/exonuclease/phosphatase domain-containing protein n=1 Tax=Streptomyces sodiiphilus TaxID=226217 RepID=A0ABN2P4G3_9ACTN